jgi:hypothetical protein
MVRSILTALAVTSLAASTARAQSNGPEPVKLPARWAAVGISDDRQMLVYIDTTTVTRDGSRVMVWVRSLYSTTQNDALGANYRATLVRYTINCSARTLGLGGWATYTADGTTANSGTFSGTPDDIPPGSIAEGVLNAVCRGLK